MHRTAEPYCWCGINCAHWQLETRKERLAQQTNRISIDRDFTMQIHRRVKKSSKKTNYPNKTKRNNKSNPNSNRKLLSLSRCYSKCNWLNWLKLTGMATICDWPHFSFQCGICKTKIGRSKCGWTNFDFMKSKTFRSQHLITVRQVNCILDWLLRFRNWLRTTGCLKTIRIQSNVVYHFISFQIEIHVFYDTFNSMDFNWTLFPSPHSKEKRPYFTSVHRMSNAFQRALIQWIHQINVYNITFICAILAPFVFSKSHNNLNNKY